MGLSPNIEETEVLLSFPEALMQLVKGKKITRVEWNNTDYGFLKEGFIAIHRNNEDFNHWSISDGDILATDWKIIE